MRNGIFIKVAGTLEHPDQIILIYREAGNALKSPLIGQGQLGPRAVVFERRDLRCAFRLRRHETGKADECQSHNGCPDGVCRTHTFLLSDDWGLG